MFDSRPVEALAERGDGPSVPRVEVRDCGGHWVKRLVLSGERSGGIRLEPPAAAPDEVGVDAWDQAWLRGARWWAEGRDGEALRIADLFCAAGGFSLGARLGAALAGLRGHVVLAGDHDPRMLDIYRRNHAPSHEFLGNLGLAVDYRVTTRGGVPRFVYPPEPVERPLRRAAETGVDVVVAGPPCQGHSNLNNHTRRNDPRNTLYLVPVAFGVAVGADVVVIENVPSVLNSVEAVSRVAREVGAASGYVPIECTLDASQFGVAQRRKRHFLVLLRRAGGSAEARFFQILRALSTRTRTVRWAIEDLRAVDERKDPLHRPAALSSANRDRIAYLFEHDLYELPDPLRPPCHRDGHTYPSVYGRLRWDEPAGTITQGFHSPGRGRFVHPGERRTLTAREAARLQGFPDSYDLCAAMGTPRTNVLAKAIGEAVPPPLGAAVLAAALATIRVDGRQRGGKDRVAP